MKKQINNELLGEVVYEESFWTGKKNITINGKTLAKKDKKTFILEVNKEAKKETLLYLKGSFLSGASLSFDNEVIEIYPKPKWYEYVLCFLPLLVNLIWGNSVALCSIIPVVGGAIGGAITGLFSILGLIISRLVKKPLLKVLIYLLALVVSFGICAAIGFAIVAAIS